MRILALDPADNCGWALYNEGRIESGVWPLSPKKLKGYEGGGMRYARLQDRLDGLGSIDRVGYEAVRRHLGTSAAHCYGGYKAVITSWCEQCDPKVPYCVFSVSKIKMRATGKGRSSKDKVRDAAEIFFDKKIESDDESDALWILVLMCEEMGLEL